MQATSSQSRGAALKGQLRFFGNQRGQLVVEYILLLIISVSIALVITSTMVSRNEENPGFMITKWRQIIDTIAADTSDDLAPQAE